MQLGNVTKRELSGLLSIFGALLISFLIVTAARAVPPSSVTLTYFRGAIADGGVRLQWQTATELDTAGFRLRRAANENGTFENLSEIGLVEARGSAVSGSNYEALDTTAPTGETSWYELVEVELDGSEHVVRRISVAGDQGATATTEGIATPEATGDATGDATGNATSTPEPTATITVAATESVQPTQAASTPTVAEGSAQADEVVSPSPTRRVVGQGVVEASEEEIMAQPTAVAQVTSAYPAPTSTQETSDTPYPGSAPAETPIIIEATVDGYPFGSEPSSTVESRPQGDPFANSVGASSDESSAEGVEGRQTSTSSRILLWVGFVGALLLFIAGAVVSIIISTRRPRQDL